MSKYLKGFFPMLFPKVGIFSKETLGKPALRTGVFLRVWQTVAHQDPHLVSQFCLFVRQDIFLIAQSGYKELIDMDNAHLIPFIKGDGQSSRF